MNNSSIDINILEAYLKGTLDPKAMHRVEKEALEDPFVAEALEGLSQSAAYAQNLSLLQKQLHDRVAEQKEIKKANVMTWQRLSIAAAAAVVFISVGALFLMRGSNTGLQQQVRNNKAVEVVLTPDAPDSTTVSVVAALPEKEMEKAREVVAAPAKQVAVPKKIEQEISVAMAEAKPAVLAKNAVKPQQREVIVLSPMGKKEGIEQSTATGATVLQSRIEDIVVPTVQGKMVSPKDGRTPIADPIVKPELGNNAETVAYAQNVKPVAAHSLSSTLRDNGNALNELVIPAYSKFAPAKSVPVPSLDNAAYTTYLRKSNKLYKGEGSGQFVELSFSVSKAGKPENIKVLKGLEEAQNNEAIRLLADGPKWILPKKGSNKATLKVYF